MGGPRRLRALAIAGVLAALAAAPGAGSASPYIDVHVSVKIIRNPATGTRPPIDDANVNDLITNQDITDLFDRINTNDSLLSGYQRGFRFVVDEIIDIGATCGGNCNSCASTTPGWWYCRGFGAGTVPSLLDLETMARSQPAFQWKSTRVNVYVNQGQGNGAVSSFPPRHVVVVGAQVWDPDFIPNFGAATVLHELGHYFNLSHTNGGACKPEECFTPACPNPVPTDGDGLSDTLPDDPCWGLNPLSQFHYGVIYLNLTPAQRVNIDNIFWNNMTYLHPNQAYGETFVHRMTEQQLDRWADACTDTSRVWVRSGRTWFVSTGGSLSGTGMSFSQFRNPSQGRDAANAAGGDIILLRPGVYNQVLTFDHPVTLRVARGGTATIGP